MSIGKGDFVELEFIARVLDGEIFDTNIKSEAEKINVHIDENPFIICIGKEMVIKGLDAALEKKELGKKYSIKLKPKEAFGMRNPNLIRLIPINSFLEKKVNPRPGMTLALDNALVKVISVSGGRVLVDFNNPLAGKIIVYDFTIKRKIEDLREKVNAITNFFIKRELDFSIKEDNKKIVFKIEPAFKPIIQIIDSKIKDVLGYEMVLEEKKEAKFS